MHTATLTQFGLSDKEAKVYASLLALGTVEASKIAAKAGLNRSTTYVLLESLAKRGLVEASRRGSIQLFTASQPEKLTEMAEAEVEKFTNLIKIGKDLIPALKALSVGDTSKPKVRVIEGVKGLKSLYEEIATTRSTVSAVLPSSSGSDSYFGYLNTKNGRTKNNLRVILPTGINLNSLTPSQLSSVQDLSTLPMANLESEVFVFDQTIALVSGSAKSACIVEDKGLAKIIQTLFDSATSKAQRIALKPGSKTKTQKVLQKEKGEKEKVLAEVHKRFLSAD